MHEPLKIKMLVAKNNLVENFDIIAGKENVDFHTASLSNRQSV